MTRRLQALLPSPPKAFTPPYHWLKDLKSGRIFIPQKVRCVMTMTTPTASPFANVVPLQPVPPIVPKVKAADAKWGAAVMKLGYCMVPSLLLRAQHRLRLTPTQLAVLLQLCDFWWDEARKPFPSKEKLALRLGMKPRQLQRHLADLEKAGLVNRVARYNQSTGGRETNVYDLSGLVSRLKELEPEFREAEAEIREKRQSLQKPGLRRRNSINKKEA